MVQHIRFEGVCIYDWPEMESIKIERDFFVTDFE